MGNHFSLVQFVFMTYSSDINSLFYYRLSIYNHISQLRSMIKKEARNSPLTFQVIPKITSSRKNKCILRFWWILPFLIQVKKALTPFFVLATVLLQRLLHGNINYGNYLLCRTLNFSYVQSSSLFFYDVNYFDFYNYSVVLWGLKWFRSLLLLSFSII